MSSGIDGIGEAVTGGLAADAVEPEAGGPAHAPPADCLNCGAALTGPHCAQCGQKGHVHRSLAAFWHDLAHGVLHFEGKIWRTLPMLAWRPGELTRRYIEGERARFVSPMALFLFSVFLMFAVFSLTGGPFEPSPDLAIQPATAPHGAAATRSAAAAQDLDLDIGNPDAVAWLNRAWHEAQRNPELLAFRLQTNAYKFSWALIPISTPLIWLLFLHRRRYRRYKAFDHVVFVTYSIAFMSLGLIALSLLRAIGIGQPVTGLAVAFIPPIHIYRQLRGAYQLSRLSALWRTVMLLLFAGIAAVIFLVAMLVLGMLE